MKEKNVLIIGEMNSENIGDKAIFEGLKHSLFTSNDKIKISELSFSSGQKKTDIPSIQPQKSNIGKIILKKVIKKNYKVYSLFNMLKTFFYYYKNRNLVKSEFRKSDLIIVGGGALLQDNAMTFPAALYVLSIMSKKFSKKISVVGCSSGNKFSWLSKKFINKFLLQTDQLYMRDPKSVEIIYREFNIDSQIIPDNALRYNIDHILSDTKKDLKNKKLLKIGINLMTFSNHGIGRNEKFKKEYEKIVLECIQIILNSERESEIHLFTTGEDSDLEIIKKIKLNHNDIKLFVPKDLSDLLVFINGLDTMLNTRLHASILGLLLKKPISSIIWDDKVKGFYELCGLSDRSFNIKKDFSANDIVRTIFDFESSDSKFEKIKEDLVIHHKKNIEVILSNLE